MSEIVDRVAESMRVKFASALPATKTEQLPSWSDLARVAIEGMREPTMAMIFAAKNPIDEQLLKEAQISLMPELMRQAWVAAIEEALK